MNVLLATTIAQILARIMNALIQRAAGGALKITVKTRVNRTTVLRMLAASS